MKTDKNKKNGREKQVKRLQTQADDLSVNGVKPEKKGASGGGNDMYGDTDTEGSYTGVPHDPREIPIQDADDL